MKKKDPSLQTGGPFSPSHQLYVINQNAAGSPLPFSTSKYHRRASFIHLFFIHLFPKAAGRSLPPFKSFPAAHFSPLAPTQLQPHHAYLQKTSEINDRSQCICTTNIPLYSNSRYFGSIEGNISLATVLRKRKVHLANSPFKFFPPCTARTPAGGECRFSTTLPPTPPPSTSNTLSQDLNSQTVHANLHLQYHPARRTTAISLHSRPAVPIRRGRPAPHQHLILCASTRNHRLRSPLHPQ